MTVTAEKRLGISLVLTIFIFCIETAGGILSNSLALMSDAGHVLTDAFALGLSLIAARISRRPSDFRATYGYKRVGLLAAVINGLSLIIIAAFIFTESYKRFLEPVTIALPVMMSVAIIGLAGNILMAAVLKTGHTDLNIKSAWLHILGDTLSSVSVIISGAVIFLTGWTYADPLVSLLIGTIIIIGGVRVIKEAVMIFLEMVPRGFNIEDIARNICSLPGVSGVHDVHIWSVAHGDIAFTAHIWVHDQKLSEAEEIRKSIEEALKDKGITHIILQLECAECETKGLYCEMVKQGK